jgi:hypothetical protein
MGGDLSSRGVSAIFAPSARSLLSRQGDEDEKKFKTKKLIVSSTTIPGHGRSFGGGGL